MINDSSILKKRVNVKAVLVLAAVVVALGVGVHLVHGFQVKRNARGLVEQAGVLEQEGKLVPAADYLEQYLGLMPRDTDALAKYGLLRDRVATKPRARLRAYFVLEQVLRRDDQRLDVRRRAAKLAAELGLFADAKVHLDILRKDNPRD